MISYNAASRQPVIFDSNDSRFDDVLIWRACRASAAAPTYLAEAEFSLDGVEPTAFLDGGIVANDPAAVALAKVFGMRLDSESALVVSLGTGQSGNGFNPGRFWKWSGTMPWSASLASTLMEASNGAFESIIAKTLDADHYFRFNTALKLAKPDIDAAQSKQILALKNDANDFWIKEPTKERRRALVAQLDCNSLVDLDSLVGRWKSTFTWTVNGELKTGKHEIKLDVQWHSFLLGVTTPGSEYPGCLQAGKVGKNIVGHWYSLEKNYASSFVLFRESDTYLKGRWLGSGDLLDGLYHGEWTMERSDLYVKSVMPEVRDLHGTSCTTIGSCYSSNDEYPIFALTMQKTQNAMLPWILITGGVHGDEHAGVFAAIEFLRNHAVRYADRCNFAVLPCVNPTGFDAETLCSSRGANLNRLFGVGSLEP